MPQRTVAVTNNGHRENVPPLLSQRARGRGSEGAFRTPFSLRARLIASHSLVITLALLLVLIFSAAYLRRYERSVEKERIEQFSKTLTISTNFLTRQNPPETAAARIEAIDALAEQENIRLLVLNRNARVFYDSEENDNLFGQTLPAWEPTLRDLIRRANDLASVQQQWADPPDSTTFPGQLILLSSGGEGKQGRVLAIIAPPRRYPLLARYLPRIVLVAVISLAIASLAGYLLSRRIAAPIGRLTHAANAMASGRLEQVVTGDGHDELGQLIGSFNTMSRRVAATDRSQRDLLANVAHELRTPLTSVQGFAQALRDGVIDTPDEQRRALEIVGGESARMATLIDQLLDLSRLESGQTQLKMTAVPVQTLFTQIANRFEPTAQHKGVTLRTDSDVTSAIAGDEGRLVQMLSNLVDNAIRHTEAGGTVALTAVLIAGTTVQVPDTVQLTVADTGEGIPAALQPHIFDRFIRGETEVEERRGFGLGLPIVRELVAMHHGTINLKSQPNRGTTWLITLPAAPSPNHHRPDDARSRSAAITSPS